MSKSVFAKIIIIIKAEEDDINNHYEAVENEYVELFNELDELEGKEYKLISLLITEE